MLKKLSIFLLTACMAVLLLGCELFMPKAESGEKTITVVFDMAEYAGDIAVTEGIADYQNKVKQFTVTTEAKRLETVLDELSEDKKITFSGTKSSSGFFITDIDNMTLPANNYFLIFSDDAENTNTTWGEHEFDGITYYSISNGITMQPVKDGCVYVFTIVVYN